MAIRLPTMSSPGGEVRRVRRARGLSQAELARMAGVSLKTITRIENDRDYADHRSLPVVEAALGINDDGGDPPLSKATAAQFVAELANRLSTLERLLEHSRIRTGEVPPGVATDPRTIRDTDSDRRRDQGKADG